MTFINFAPKYRHKRKLLYSLLFSLFNIQCTVDISYAARRMSVYPVLILMKNKVGFLLLGETELQILGPIPIKYNPYKNFF